MSWSQRLRRAQLRHRQLNFISLHLTQRRIAADAPGEFSQWQPCARREVPLQDQPPQFGQELLLRVPAAGFGRRRQFGGGEARRVR